MPIRADHAPGSGSPVSLGQAAEFELGGLRVNPARRLVVFKDTMRLVEPRVMQVLVVLAGARSKVVPRDQLVQSCWGGLTVGDDAVNRCIVALRHLAREFEPQPFSIETIPRVGYSLSEGPAPRPDRADFRRSAGKRLQSRAALPVVAFAVLGALAVGILLSKPGQPELEMPSVAVAPAGPGPVDDSAARDLLAQLGTLHAPNEEALRILDQDSRSKADFLFEVDGLARGQQVGANLVLLANGPREVLWSTDFQPTNRSDLKQQLGVAAAKVLECATEGVAGRGVRLDRQTLKLYLNGCAAYADLTEADTSVLRSTFSQVTRNAPAFEPGWSKLLLVEADRVQGVGVDSKGAAASRTHLQRTLAAARKLHPELPELLVAEAALLPAAALAARLRLVEQAIEQGPEIPQMFDVHAAYLMKVGRMDEAVRQARHAVRLDPLSPTARTMLAATLAYEGSLEEGLKELRNAKQLWPRATSVVHARYGLQLRAGDAEEALVLRRSGAAPVSGAPTHDHFLNARIDPSPANVERAIRNARAQFERNPVAIVQLAQTLGAFGRDDELFPILLNWSHPDKVDFVVDVLFRPGLRNFRRDPRMMAVAARLGLLDYWRTTGHWPDFCLEPDLPYDCKREAIKYAA